ncbi:MAG TPA: hypothetical protein VKC33_02830 [Burkholderiales bacterium]|nr:hypothetical protein [Burkholderiales bacterium]
MHPALKGALVGLGIAVVLFLFDYLQLRARAAERAKKNHKTIVEFDQTDKGRVIALVRFLVFVPPGFALLFWMMS